MSVSSLNTKIKSILEATFMHTKVEGEVASLTYHSSGHLYFSIKDDNSTIKCVMWKSAVFKLKFQLKQGLHIVVDGSVGVYTPRGEYQFYVTNIEPYGQGALALAYQQLKEKLQEKGYFESNHKKAIPKYIQKIALVTAKNSAGLHDMLKIIEYRWAMVEVTIVDTLVQGKNASYKIANALEYADTLGVDVVVVGRGGGSVEDLWCFNEEVVADAIFNMKTPIVSAVGHEIDILISDFVADLRAPTPSASMEMILPDAKEILYMLEERRREYKQIMNQKIITLSDRINHHHKILLNQSPLVKMNAISELFMELKNNFKRQQQFFENKKIEELKILEQQFLLNNPNHSCRKGWAKISQNEVVCSLSFLELNEKFILEDETVKIEALCLRKL